MNSTTLREVSNNSGAAGADAKQRLAQRLAINWALYRVAPTSRTSGQGLCAPAEKTVEMSLSPRADECLADDPVFCGELAKDIVSMYMEKEKQAERQAVSGGSQALASSGYLTYQPEINEKMRMILVDWLIDVHLKFKLNPETMYLAVNIIDRYLSCVNTKRSPTTYVARSQLQLVGITGMLLAAKYEEIWPPEVKECVHISANTYTREEVIKMERNICAALSFRLTVPTPFPFLVRLLTVIDAMGRRAYAGGEKEEQEEERHKARMTQLRHTAFFFLEHSLLDYKCLQFLPSQQANAALFLALVTLRMKQQRGVSFFPLLAGEAVWTRQLQHYSGARAREFRACAEAILDFVGYVPTTKYQAVRRKYSSAKYGEVAKFIMPEELPDA